MFLFLYQSNKCRRIWRYTMSTTS